MLATFCNNTILFSLRLSLASALVIAGVLLVMPSALPSGVFTAFSLASSAHCKMSWLIWATSSSYDSSDANTSAGIPCLFLSISSFDGCGALSELAFSVSDSSCPVSFSTFLPLLVSMLLFISSTPMKLPFGARSIAIG